MEYVAGADLHKRVIRLTLLREGQDPSQYRIRNDPPTVESGRGVESALDSG